MNVQIYRQRRNILFDEIGAGFVLSAFDSLQQTNDSPAPFVQEANFYYLTGIEEPGWQLVVDSNRKSALIAPDFGEIHRIFDGGLSDERAKEISGVHRVVSVTEGEDLIKRLISDDKGIGVIGPDSHEEYLSFSLNPAPKRLYTRLKNSDATVIDIRSILSRLRGRKDEEELGLIRQAVNVTVDAFEKVKQSLDIAAHEYNLEAEFTYAFRNQGLIHAYEPIVASGANACTLHYGKNSEALPKNGLVLMDVGARFEGYAADITRTYAIGTPSEREVAVHAAVEKAHHTIIALLKPNLSVKTYHEKVDEIMKDALKELGLFNTPDDYRKYFPHAISHGLGIDVHDPLGAPKYFEPGMVLTVEPGIYIPEEGIGVRIEDDILITEDGHENLSGQLSTSL